MNTSRDGYCVCPELPGLDAQVLDHKGTDVTRSTHQPPQTTLFIKPLLPAPLHDRQHALAAVNAAGTAAKAVTPKAAFMKGLNWPESRVDNPRLRATLNH
jgi:hypothetical protein